ncbi:nucleotidyltransferase family protein [Synechococcus sp. BA-132 BA5]|uniref:nucleotidyltransferase family protein n=1 Tax=Synechococcus sp. BA-132 BA5 TaxID=3110252 RepID=UPI002B208314|nr:nucleotidyltransferase domain-containing protein [Synechococcus sp. BA-132 BA5]MEA5414763.1 nucleotidyltransferase domain-containing protein [Synechococcus sp. BA-132 BA5]
MDTVAPLLPLLADRLEPLRHLCNRYGVDRLEVFGSAAKGLFDPASSDLDFIVKMTGQREPGYARRFCSFADELEALFGCPVDLLTESMIHNPYFRNNVDASRRLLLELRHAKGGAETPS